MEEVALPRAMCRCFTSIFLSSFYFFQITPAASAPQYPTENTSLSSVSYPNILLLEPNPLTTVNRHSVVKVNVNVNTHYINFHNV